MLAVEPSGDHARPAAPPALAALRDRRSCGGGSASLRRRRLRRGDGLRDDPSLGVTRGRLDRASPRIPRAGRGLLHVRELDHLPAWQMEFLHEGLLRERPRFPSIDEIAAALGGRTRVEHIPTPGDCVDGFFEAFWRRPEALLDPAVRGAQSMWALLEPGVQQRIVDRSSSPTPWTPAPGTPSTDTPARAGQLPRRAAPRDLRSTLTRRPGNTAWSGAVCSDLAGRAKRGTQESNLALRFWRPPCYRYTSPPGSPRL